jgi:DNA-binding NarL/FixJ family response regulator
MMAEITVLLADDHTVVRDGLRVLLEASGDIRVIGTAPDGRTAIDEVRRLKPAVVVMDIAMPALNGIDATMEILRVQPGTNVLILSMHYSSEHVYRALQAGACGYLLKESAGAEVVQAVRAAAAGRRYLSQKITDTVVEDYLREGRREGPLESLSPRERQILQLTVEGRSSAEIGNALHLSPKTVDTYRSRLMQKLGIDDTAGLVKFAIQNGLTAI